MSIEIGHGLILVLVAILLVLGIVYLAKRI